MEVPANIEIKIGETYTFRLPGLGTAGYRWSYEIEGNTRLIDVFTVEAENQQPLSVGSNQDEVFVLRALALGRYLFSLFKADLGRRIDLPTNSTSFRL